MILLPNKKEATMKLIIKTKNCKANEDMKGLLEKKFKKLEKFFRNETEANLLIKEEKGKFVVEVTMFVDSTIFRAEKTEDDILTAVDHVVSKLSSQLSKHKTKLQKKHKGHVGFDFSAIPEADNAEERHNVVKTKEFELKPMDVEEAILQMELVDHDFFVYLDRETNKVGVVYKRKNDSYGNIAPKY